MGLKRSSQDGTEACEVKVTGRSARLSSVLHCQLYPGVHMELVNGLRGLEVGTQRHLCGAGPLQPGAAQGLDHFPGQVNDQPTLGVDGKDGLGPRFNVLLVTESGKNTICVRVSTYA